MMFLALVIGFCIFVFLATMGMGLFGWMFGFVSFPETEVDEDDEFEDE